MRRNFCYLILVLTLLAPPVLAQTATGPGGMAVTIDPHESRAKQLDALFQRLKDAQDERVARGLERQISGLMMQSGSETADLLLSRAIVAFSKQEADLSISLLDALTDLKPDFAEGWFRRATIRYQRKELFLAAEDIEQALKREPRHFSAWMGLSLIFRDLDRPKAAIFALRQAQSINPHAERVAEMIKRLAPEADGRDL